MQTLHLARGAIYLLSLFPVLCGLALAAAASAQKPDPPHAVSLCWQYPVTGLSSRGVASDATRVFLSRESARIEAVSAEVGERLWISELGGEIISNLALGRDDLYVVTRSTVTVSQNSTSALRSISKDTGITNWVVGVPASNGVVLGVAGDSVVHASYDGNISAILMSDGSRRWSANISSGISAGPVIADSGIAIGTRDMRVQLLSATNGTRKLDISTRFLPTAVAVRDADHLAWGDERGNVYFYDSISKGRRWRLKQGGKTASLKFVGDAIISSSLDNFVYMIGLSDGKIRWKQRQSNRISGIESWGNGLFVVLDILGSSASILDSDGKLVNQLTPAEQRTFTEPPAIINSFAIFPSSDRLAAYGLDGCKGK